MGNPLNSTDRLPYVDVAKGVGILLVVLGHNAAFEPTTPIAKFIYSFHMPLFYFLAGLFHDDAKNFLPHVSSKAKSLLLPCILAFATWLVIQAIIIPDILFPSLRDLWINALYGTGKTLFWGQLWFLTSLFVTTCSCHLFIRSRILRNKNLRILVAIVLVPIGTWFLAWYPARSPLYWISDRFFFTDLQGLPWNIDLLPITAAFYLLGTTFPTQRFGNHGFKPHTYFFWSALLFVAISVCPTDWGMDLNNRRYDHWAGSTFIAICGIGGALLLSLAIVKLLRQWPSRTMSFIGKRSLFILVLHFSLQQNSFNKLLEKGVPWLAAVATSFAIGLGVPLAASMIWESTLRKMKGKQAPDR